MSQRPVKQRIEDLEIWQLENILRFGACIHRSWQLCENCRTTVIETIAEKRKNG